MGEHHTTIDDRENFDEIIEKQKQIIDIIVDKFGSKQFFYSESPYEYHDVLMGRSDITSSVVAQYADEKKMYIQLSNVKNCDREEGYCDEKYVEDIIDILDPFPETKCVIVAIGLLHVPQIKILLEEKYPDRKVIVVNTVSEAYLSKSMPLLTRQPGYSDLERLVETEKPYTLSRAEASGAAFKKYDYNNELENTWEKLDE